MSDREKLQDDDFAEQLEIAKSLQQADLHVAALKTQNKWLRAAITRAETAEAKLAAVKELANLVPTNWLDPILSGTASKFKGRGPYHGADIEYLLLEVRKRIKTKLKAIFEEGK